MDYLRKLMEERETLASAIEGFAVKAAERGTDLTESETTEIASLQTRCSEIDERLGTFASAQESNRRYADLVGKMGSQTIEGRAPVTTETREPSLGEAFIGSEAFTEYRGRGSSARYEYRAPLLSNAAPGSVFMPENAKVVAAAPTASTPVLDVIQRIPVSSNVVDWITYPAAAPLAANVAEGAPKPEAVFAPVEAPVTLVTVAHYAQMSRQLMEDAPAATAFVDASLRRGVLDKLESNAVAAIIAATLPTVAGATMVESIRLGVAQVQAAGFQPDTVLLNPADYADIDLSVFAAGRTGATIGSSFWGLRPVAAGAVPAGTAFVGDFSAGVSFLERVGVSLYVTDSHGDTFLHNVFTLLAEARAQTVVTQPSALAECVPTP